MNAQRLKQIEEIFHAVIDIEPGGRESFLKAACVTDADLRREVEALLNFEKTSDNFLETPPESLVAEMFAEEETGLSLVNKEIGHYKIRQLLGKGGMGEVYLAEDINLKRQVALKFLAVSTFGDKNSLLRFKREALAASSLNHPNILTIYEFNADGEACFLATEYVKGETLREKLRRGKLTLRETLKIAEQIAQALGAAHQAKIVHRDIKPENIMLREDGLAKILDFGLAKLIENPELIEDSEAASAPKLALTRTGAIMGTSSYMSPEQVRGRANLDPRTDIWSLGVVLYEMLTADVPFTGETTGDTIASILTNDTPRLSKLMADCPSELERIIEKALAKNVDERYQVIDDLTLDIKSFRQRLEFEAELKRSNSLRETPGSPPKNELALTNKEPGDSRSSTVQMRTHTASAAGDSHQNNKRKPRLIFLSSIFGLVLLTGAIGGLFLWRSNSSGVTVQSTATTDRSAASDPPVNKSVLKLTYSLTVQSWSDGRYKNPFRLSSEMLFRNKDRVRLNFRSPQTGYLYILNESPKDAAGETTFNILFPSPTTNDGRARLAADQEIQIPQQSWFELDAKEGTELVWLVWSAQALAELESAKRFANAQDRGKIKDPALVEFIAALLPKHQTNKGNIERDDDKKESQISADTAILTHVIKLEHH